jgi:surfactin synthase thioesterase subunit
VTSRASVGFPVRSRSTDPRVRLLCFPFAGGGAAAFRPWMSAFPSWVDVCAYEPPGHGTRMSAPLLDAMSPLVDDVLGGVRDLGTPLPTVLYGHSLGGLVACAVAARLSPAPRHAFLGASPPPQVEQPVRSTLPYGALIETLRRLGGSPDEVLDEPELMELFVPIVRADFRLVETRPAERLDVPLTVFAGRRDPQLRIEDARRWVEVGSAVDVVELDADHFFLVTHQTTIVGRMMPVLAAAASTASVRP